MRILIADRFPEPQRDILAARGHTVRYEPGLAQGELPQGVEDAEVLVVRSTPVAGEALAAGHALRAVVRAGSGINTIDAETAARLGVAVCNVPGRNADAVAELTLGLMLALDRRIPDATADLRQGRWRKSHYAAAGGLKGRTLGLVGLGAVGRAVAERAAPFGLALLGIERAERDPAVTARCRGLGMSFVPDLAALAERCDILSLHVPATSATTGLIDRQLLARVPPGAFIVNTSRGELVDTPALIEAMDHKDVRAALDVFDHEPEAGEADFEHPLARHPNVYGTHHIGASTEQAQQAIAEEVVAIVDDLVTGHARHCVNSPGTVVTDAPEPATR
jgi:D-3-phosphoglycerate dehydrogenase